MDCVISTKCFCKIVMHSLKYPSNTVNGLLLAEKRKKKDSSYLYMIDSVPLFHISHGLTSCLEITLLQVSTVYSVTFRVF